MRSHSNQGFCTKTIPLCLASHFAVKRRRFVKAFERGTKPSSNINSEYVKQKTVVVSALTVAKCFELCQKRLRTCSVGACAQLACVCVVSANAADTSKVVNWKNVELIVLFECIFL